MNYAQAGIFFAKHFEQSPSTVASAPARVNLIGEHTDYNGGQVLPIGIERRTYLAIRAVPNASSSRIVSHTESSVGIFDVRQPVRAGQWWDYVTGVAHILGGLGLRLPQLEIAVASDVPTGAGLSSSAALEVAATLALVHVAGASLIPQEVATIAWRAETEFVGVPSGIMDQYASAAAKDGNALHVWCDTLRTESIPCHESILIFDTGVSRALRRSQFSLRRAQCESALELLQCINPGLMYLAHTTPEEIDRAGLPSVLRNRALHVVLENRRVEAVVDALCKGQVIPGNLLIESHESLRNLYECSIPELDWFVEQVIREPGVRGARLTGAGWGGCAIAIGESKSLADAAESLLPRYQSTFGHMARTWLTLPASGARLEL